VGKHAHECHEYGVVPLGIRELEMDGEFTAPIIPDSDVPGLLGLASLTEKSAILNCQSRQLLLPGPGGVEIKMSPGSRTVQLEVAPSGHLLMPVTEFRRNRVNKRVSFVTAEPEPISTSSSSNSSQLQPGAGNSAGISSNNH
jgi:hypothetical protein